MNRPIRALALMGLALSTLGLSACNQEEKSPVRPNVEGKGSARIALPALPKGYLVLPGAQALFALTVSGEGMDPIRRSWVLKEGFAPAVTLDGIPAGHARIFEGRLVRIDTAGGDTIVTHEGVETAWISRDSTAEVRLYLRAGGNGKAHVCVEVEGWPVDPSCIQPPDTTGLFIGGCWNLTVNKPGPKIDTLFKGRLQVDQSGNFFSVRLTWESGAVDSTTGEVYPDGVAYFGPGLSGDFLFKSLPDSVGDLFGWFDDPGRGISGYARAVRASCDTVSPPTYIRACFNFKQTLVQGKSGSGRIGFESWGEGWVGTYFHWDGFKPEYAIGNPIYGSIGDSALVYVGAHPPAGMFPTKMKIDSVGYMMNLQLGIGSGSLHQIGGINDGIHLGDWSGHRTECKESDFQF